MLKLLWYFDPKGRPFIWVLGPLGFSPNAEILPADPNRQIMWTPAYFKLQRQIPKPESRAFVGCLKGLSRDHIGVICTVDTKNPA